MVSAGYIGSRSDRAVGSGLGAGGENYNLAPPGPGNVNTRRPFFAQLPGVTNITVRESKYKQWYDALQLMFQRRYRAGLTLSTHYTLANAELTAWSPWDITIVEQFTNATLVKHRYVFTADYELPFRFGNQTAQHVLGGWQVNASAFWQSGLPFDVTNQNAAVNNGGTDRPNLVGDPNLPKSERTVDRWFNTACVRAAGGVHRRKRTPEHDDRSIAAPARPVVLQERGTRCCPTFAGALGDLQRLEYGEFRAAEQPARQPAVRPDHEHWQFDRAADAVWRPVRLLSSERTRVDVEPGSKGEGRGS